MRNYYEIKYWRKHKKVQKRKGYNAGGVGGDIRCILSICVTVGNELCYPDIEMIPVIAAFFEISVDTLMGIDNIAEETSVNKYLEEFQIAVSQGKVEECIEIARRGVKEFPNSYPLLNKLMYALFLSGSDDANIENWQENREKYDKEIVSLGERIMKYCTNDEIRLEATQRLAFHHSEMGRKDVGRKIFENLPSMWVCREEAIWWALEDNEKLSYTRDLISKAYSLLSCGLYRLGHLVDDKNAIEVYKTYMEIENMLYQGETIPDSWSKAKINFLIAKHYLNLGDNDSASKHIKLCLNAAQEFDNRSDKMETNSLFLGKRTVSKSDFETADSRPLTEILFDTWLEGEEFAQIKNELNIT